MKNFFNKGITIIEMLVVIAIIGIIVLIVSPQFSNLRNNQILKSTGEDILSVLNKARSQTLASLNSSEYGVHFQPNGMVLFKGNAYSSDAVNNEIIELSSPASISNVTLGGVSGPTGNVYFNRLSGVPDKTGTIIIMVSSLSKIVTISATGGFSID